MGVYLQTSRKLDRASRERAEQEGQEGATLARDRGIDATATVRARSGTVADTILTEADEIGADAIVLGSRGLGDIAYFSLAASHTQLSSQRTARL